MHGGGEPGTDAPHLGDVGLLGGTVLSDIPGLGPTRVKELLKHFGSVTRLRGAGEADIAEVKGIGPALATTIHAHLHADGVSAPR